MDLNTMEIGETLGGAIARAAVRTGSTATARIGNFDMHGHSVTEAKVGFRAERS